MKRLEKATTKSPWRWLRRIIIALIALAAIFFLVVVPVGLSWLITHAKSRPSDRTMSASPQEYGLEYETVQFTATDGTPLRGWYLPVANSPCVIIYGHGMFRSRVEMLERAAMLAHRGYAGLLLDFRRHGESGGELTSIGYLERLDVLGAVKYIRETLHLQQPIVSMSVSMGTAASMLAAAESKEIAGLILDSSFRSFDDMIAHHAKSWLGLPRFPIVDELILSTEIIAGFDGKDFDLRRAIQRIGDRPILFIVGGQDKRMPPEISQELYDLSPSSHKQIFIVPAATHGAAFKTDRTGYEERVVAFLEANFGPAVRASE